MKMTIDEKAEQLAEKYGKWYNCDTCNGSHDSSDECFGVAMEMAEWMEARKDKWFEKVLLVSMQQIKEFHSKNSTEDFVKYMDSLIETIQPK